MPGRFRTGSNPLKTSIAAALYSLLILPNHSKFNFIYNAGRKIKGKRHNIFRLLPFALRLEYYIVPLKIFLSHAEKENPDFI
jgi:hypothetical protein